MHVAILPMTGAYLQCRIICFCPGLGNKHLRLLIGQSVILIKLLNEEIHRLRGQRPPDVFPVHTASLIQTWIY